MGMDEYFSAAAAQVDRDHSARLVHRDGNFNANIVKDLKLDRENCPVAAVSIIGVQSTGKSTLLNKRFSTNFQEMDDGRGMKRATEGIRIAKWASPNDGPKILVIETEGSAGSGGRQGDDTFEKKTALFVLAISNTLIFNMKCDQVNLHHGGCRPLLENVLEAMLRKFNKPREVNIVFVLRDKNECSLKSSRDQLTGEIKKIWQGILSRTQSDVKELEKYFKIEVMVMSHYKLQKQEFVKEVGNLRELVMTFVQKGQRFRPASSFAAEAKEIWKDIKEDKILNLQQTKINAGNAICGGVADEIYKKFCGNKSWAKIKEKVKAVDKVKAAVDKVKDLVNVNPIIGKYIKKYNEKTQGTDESKRKEHRKKLIERMLEDVRKIHLPWVINVRKAILQNFREALAQGIKEDRLEHMSMNSKKVVREFTAFLKAANIKEANWNHPDEQLKKLESELVSMRKRLKALLKTKTN